MTTRKGATAHCSLDDRKEEGVIVWVPKWRNSREVCLQESADMRLEF